MTASPIPQHVSLVTLGVQNVARSREFYEALGFHASSASNEHVTFFDMNGSILALFARSALAVDAGVTDTHPEGGFSGVSCAINLAAPAAVDAALAHASQCGARLIKSAHETFWGGYSGYFADPDGHLWEVAHNPHWPLNENGWPTLPPPPAKLR